MLKNISGRAPASRNYFSDGSLSESSGGEQQIFRVTGSGEVLQIDDLKNSFCD
jgi:hypothetical protein